MIKKKVLAKKYIEERAGAQFWDDVMRTITETGFIDGFDSGFQAAIDLLSGPEAQTFSPTTSERRHEIWSPDGWAQWLSSQKDKL